MLLRALGPLQRPIDDRVSLKRQNAQMSCPSSPPLAPSGQSEEQILAAYPYLEAADVRAALAYAAWRTQETELPLP